MSAEDETRADAYRDQMRARIRNKRRLERALVGDRAAADAVKEAWAPLLTGQDVPLVGER